MQATPEKCSGSEDKPRGPLHRCTLVDPSNGSVPHIDFAEATDVPLGPRTHDERFGWSDRYFDRMSPLQKDALIRNVTRLVVETDFTGWSYFIQILLMICTALNRRLSSQIPVPREELASEFDPFRFDMLSSLLSNARM